MVIVLLLAGCASTPPEKHYSTLISYALSLRGAPYRYGKASPEEGFDCSGFVQHVYAQQGIYLPRTVSQMIAHLPPASKHELQAGDLVFFTTYQHKPSHVGLYVDAGQFIHAPSSRTGKVCLSSLQTDYWRNRFIGVRRPLAISIANP